MKKTKRLLWACLGFSLVMGLLYGVGISKETEAAVSLENPRRNEDGSVKWDCIWFGSYWQNDTNGDGKANQDDDKEPIKWRVLEVDGSEALLLADKCLDTQPYSDSSKFSSWQDSYIRKWLNSTFINNAFTESEQSAIITSHIDNNGNTERDAQDGPDTEDKIYLLSVEEAKNENFGFSSNAKERPEKNRIAINTQYAKGIEGAWNDSDGDKGAWLLRTPVKYAFISMVASVYYDGLVAVFDGMHTPDTKSSVRPVIRIDLNNDLWKFVEEDVQEGESTSVPDSSLQCQSACEVEVGRTKAIVGTSAYATSYEELLELAGNITWNSSDTGVAAVENCGYLPNVKPVRYETESGSYKTYRASGMVFVKGVSEGTATLTGTAPDGAKSVCEVTVSKAEDGAASDTGEGSGGSFVLSEEQSGTGGGGSAQFFPDTWTLKSTVFPVEVSRSEKEDGNYSLRVAVGVGKSDWLNNDEKWCQFKNNVNDANKYTGKVDCLNKYRERWGVKSLTGVSTSKFKALPKISVMGYMENTYDKNGNLISEEGKLAADAKWNASISWQFVTPIGPLYLNLSGGGKLSGQIGPKYDHKKKKLNVADGKLSLTPSVTLEGGYGIDKAAQLGAQGTLSVPIQIVPASKGEFIAQAAVHLKLLFVIDKTWELAKYRKQLWDKTGHKSYSYKNSLCGWSDGGTLTYMDTSFAKKTGRWNGQEKEKQEQLVRPRAAKGIEAVKAGDSFTTLLNGILPSSLPLQRQIGDKKVMVFQSYDKTRETQNSSVLMYSVCEGGTWTEPKAVWDDGCADLYADMKIVGDKLVLVWQKEKAEISGDIEMDSDSVLDSFAGNSEICCAFFNEKKGEFASPAYVTKNSECDMMPRIGSGEDGLVLAYVRNDNADLLQKTGTNIVYTRTWNGTGFGEEKELVKAPGTVDDYVLCEENKTVGTVFVGEVNGVKAVFGTDGQPIEGFEEFMQKADEGTCTNLSYEDGIVSFVKNGTLYTYSIADGKTVSYLAGESPFGATAKYCTNGDKSGYVWSVYDQESGKGRVVASLRTENGYSEPVTINETDGVIWRYLSPVLDEDGSWHIIGNTEDIETGLHSLTFVGKKEKNGLELEGVTLQETDVRDGLTGVDYFVTNPNDTSVDHIVITMTLADGTKIRESVPITILPGESLAGTVYMDMSGIDKAQNVEISVNAEGQTETAANRTTAQAGRTDVEVEAVSEESEEQVLVTATVKNKGGVNTNVVLSLYGDADKTKCMEQSDKLDITSSASSKVTFTIAKKDITYNENGAAYLALEAVADGGDYDESNNTAYVTFFHSKEEQQTAAPYPSPIQTIAPTQNPVTNQPTIEPTGSQAPTVQPMGNSAGSSVGDYKATPSLKKPVIRSAKNIKGRRIKIKLRKKIKGAAGYQIRYSTSKKFKKFSKFNTKKTKITTKKLKKKVYYICVRAFTVRQNRRTYGAWSKVKKVKVKK